MQYVSQFLGTSGGRDKFMAMFQYAFDFYHSCAKHSNIDEVLIQFGQNDLKSVLVADSFKEVRIQKISTRASPKLGRSTESCASSMKSRAYRGYNGRTNLPSSRCSP
jgi:hypothetical protein